MAKPKGPPLWAVDTVKRVSRSMTRAQRHMAPAPAVLVELMAGIWRPYALWLVAELGIADLLAQGPRDVADLARATGTHEDALFRVLRPLAHDGLLACPAPRTFALTALSQPLRSDHPQSVRQTIRQGMSTWNQRIRMELETVVRTGEPAFPRLHGGRDVWTWFAEEAPEEGRIFHDSMAELTRMSLPLLVAAHDFGRYGSVLDLGGGQGVLIAGLLKAYPSLRGGIFDLAQAIQEAPAVLEREGVRSRCELIQGSLDDGLPRGWDAYLMKHILHGLPEPTLAEMLARVREALGRGGRFLVIEMLVPETSSGTYPTHLDLQMLLSSGGRERTVSEYRHLFADHGLRLEEVARTASPLSLLVVTRA